MEVVQLSSKVSLVPGAVNMGAVRTSAGLVAVDTGLDKQSGKKLLKLAGEWGVPAAAIVNTHAHADHFGGNAQILSQAAQAQVYAPAADAPVIRRPQFEPEYLWQGAYPFAALQNKFLLAEASPVHVELQPEETFTIGDVSFQCIPLPGHAHGQVGVVVDGVCFAADAYFGSDVVDKHGLPFMVDYQRTLDSASRVLDVEANTFVPGHGQATENPKSDVEYLLKRHEGAYADVLQCVAESPASLDTLVRDMCRKYGLAPANPGSYLLIRTTVAAYVSAAVDAGMMEVDTKNGEMVFSAKS